MLWSLGFLWLLMSDDTQLTDLFMSDLDQKYKNHYVRTN